MSVAYDDGIEKVLTAKKCRSPAIVRFLHFTNLYGGAHIISTAADILEMVIKAAQMRIPFLVSRSGLTKMGHENRQQGRDHHDRPRGGRKIDAWYATLNVVEVAFYDEPEAFSNINTREELQTWENARRTM